MSLTDIQIRKAKAKPKIYRMADGNGLCLEVQPNGSKLWRYRYRFQGTANMLSLGKYPDVGLANARERLSEVRRQLANGGDPSQVRKAEKIEQLNTFGEVFEQWHKQRTTELDPTNAKGVRRRLEVDVLPYLKKRPIRDIKAPEILECLRKVETRGALETASRLLSWCGQVFRFAVASGLVESDPCRDLRGALSKPEKSHFAAFTEPDQIKGLLRAIESYYGAPITRAAMKFGILTFVRPKNLRTAEWSEIYGLDSENPEWRISGDKMKVRTDRPFIVPLAPQAVKLLKGMESLSGGGRYVFPSPIVFSKPLSNNAVTAALRRMGFTSDEMTGHGVRAMARTVCHEVLHFAPEVLEEQLAHGKAGALRDAYDRTTHMPERRRLMTEWANWLDTLLAIDNEKH